MIRSLVVTVTATLIAAVAITAQQNPIPEKFTNLQVLPKTITRAELVPIMRSFAQSLGIRCEHCHVGEGNDLSKFDFASDAKPTKAVARSMLHMVEHINGEHLKGIGEATRMPKVTCYTCHRGARTPATVVPAGGSVRAGR